MNHIQEIIQQTVIIVQYRLEGTEMFDDMIEALEDFIGGMFNQQYFVMSEEELKKSYKIVKQIYEKVAT